MDDPAPVAAERRKSPRRRALLSATLSFDDGSEGVEAMVRDLTQEGARLFVPREARLPEAFTIAIHEHEARLRALLRWRREDFAGVRFLGPAEEPGPLPPD